MRRKRWLGMFSILLVLTLFASACSGGKSESGGASPSSGEGGKNESGSPKQITLKFAGWEVSSLETESVKKGLELFMQQYPNIKVEYTTLPGGTNYITKIQTLLAGNEAPDVFFLQSDYYRDFVKRDQLLDLTSYVQSDFSLDDMIPSALAISEVDGKFYGIESCTVSPVLYYNKDIFDKANLPYPPGNPNEAWTWDEFAEVARKLTIREGDRVTQYGVYGAEDYYMTLALVMSNGGNWFTDDGTGPAVNTPEVIEVLEAIKRLRVEYGASPEAKLLTNMGMSSSQMLQTGKIAMLINGSWALQELSHMDFPVGVAVLPKFKEAVTHGQAHLHVASRNTKYPEEAWKLIKFLSSEEYQLQNVKEGLWMPNRASLYTEEGVSKWLTEGVHPEGFKELIPYFVNAKVYSYATLGAGAQKISENMTEELDKYFLVGQDVHTTVQNMEKMIQDVLAKERT
jgi:multiple sugar transport system substrate-binding protein